MNKFDVDKEKRLSLPLSMATTTMHRRSSLFELVSPTIASSKRLSDVDQRAVEQIEDELTPLLGAIDVNKDTTALDTDNNVNSDVLEKMLVNCTIIAKKTSIHEKKLWTLRLIEYFPKLIQYNEIKKKRQGIPFNFQKISMGLETAVHLYSKRVDCMHALTLESVNRTNEEAKKDDKKDDESEIIKKSTKDGNVVTLASDSSDITENIEFTNEMKNERGVNLYFKKMTGLFDATGFNGLLMANLGIRNGLELIIDGNEKINHNKQNYNLNENYIQDVLYLIISEKIKENTEIEKPCIPELFELLENKYETIDSSSKLIQDAVKASNDDEELYSNQNIQENSQSIDISIANDIPEINSLELNQNNEEVMAQYNQDIDDDFEFFHDNNDTDNPRIQQIIDNEVDIMCDIDEDESIKWLLDGVLSASTGKLENHWKFNENLPKERGSIHSKKKKTVEKTRLDMCNIPTYDINLFQRPKDKKDLLYKSKNKRKLILPEDYNIKPSIFKIHPLKPKMPCLDWLPIKQHHYYFNEINYNQEDINDNEIGFDALSNLDDYNEDVFTSTIDENQVKTTNDKYDIEEIKFNTKKIKKNIINTKELRMALWTTMDALRKKHENNHISFKEVLSNLNFIHEDNSVDLCFMCLLHLANEHGFYLNDKSIEKGLIIVFK